MPRPLHEDALGSASSERANYIMYGCPHGRADAAGGDFWSFATQSSAAPRKQASVLSNHVS